MKPTTSVQPQTTTFHYGQATTSPMPTTSMNEDQRFLSMLKLPKNCPMPIKPQTRFPFSWGTITSYKIIDVGDPSGYQNDLQALYPGRGREENFWDYRSKSYLRFKKSNRPLRMGCSFKFSRPSGIVSSYNVRVRGNPNDFKDHDELK